MCVIVSVLLLKLNVRLVNSIIHKVNTSKAIHIIEFYNTFNSWIKSIGNSSSYRAHKTDLQLITKLEIRKIIVTWYFSLNRQVSLKFMLISNTWDGNSNIGFDILHRKMWIRYDRKRGEENKNNWQMILSLRRNKFNNYIEIDDNLIVAPKLYQHNHYGCWTPTKMTH